VVRISDPYGLKRRAKKATSSTIPIGTFVNVTFDGKTLNKVYKVPSKIIKEEDQVWVEDNGKLVFKAISIAHRANEDVYISSGLKDGDHIIVSNIPTPIEGMHIERTGKQGQQK